MVGWEICIGQENVATAVIRSFLGRLLQIQNVKGDGPVLVVATPQTQHHELGSLTATIVAASHNWHVVYTANHLNFGIAGIVLVSGILKRACVRPEEKYVQDYNMPVARMRFDTG